MATVIDSTYCGLDHCVVAVLCVFDVFWSACLLLPAAAAAVAAAAAAAAAAAVAAAAAAAAAAAVAAPAPASGVVPTAVWI